MTKFIHGALMCGACLLGMVGMGTVRASAKETVSFQVPLWHHSRSSYRVNPMVPKRLFDIALGTLLLVILCPLMVAVGVVVRVRMGKPVFFRQTRAGWHGVPFELLKFRTMMNSVGPDGVPASDGVRLTSLGRFLRSTSLDELPELWNVLNGDMSLVGPRPLFLDYLPLYSPEQMRRLDVKPGITGLAQVNGRNGIPWEKKFELDVWYVDHWSLALDIKIVCLTIPTILGRQGISAQGHDTAQRFTGGSA